MPAFELPPRPAGAAEPGSGREPVALRIGELYERHHRMVRALCQLLLRNPVDAEDAVQETFLCALDSLLEGTVPEAPAAWLATIARRECWARVAQRRRQPLALDETTAPPADADPLDEAIRNADLTALWAAIDSLPRQQRKAFLMRELSGLSYAEVAEALGASESAIESLLVRARRQVRDGLAPLLRAANLVTTPVMLLHHRVQRLLDTNAGGGAGAGAAATTAAAPVAAKVAAAVVAVVAVGSAGAKIAPHAGILDDSSTRPAVPGPTPRAAAGSSRTRRAGTTPSPLRRRAAIEATGQAVPPALRRRPGRTPFEVRRGGGATAAATGPAPETTTSAAAPGPSPSAEPAAAPGTVAAAGATPTATTGEHTLTDPAPVDAAKAETTGADTAGTGPSPTDTTRSETTDEPTAPAESPTEEAGTDPTPAPADADPAPADTHPAPDAAPDTASADTAPADVSPAETPGTDQSSGGADADPAPDQ